MRLSWLLPPVPVFLALAGCALMPHPADPQIAAMADDVATAASAFYATLAGEQAPDCAYGSNAAGYDKLDALAADLKLDIVAAERSAALVKASDALIQTLADARATHVAASARLDDANGACMAAGAITIDADAVQRAATAIATTQSNPGAQ